MESISQILTRLASILKQASLDEVPYTKGAWYDFLKLKAKEKIEIEIKEVFGKHFQVHHRFIDNSKTEIEVLPPLAGSEFIVKLFLYNKDKVLVSASSVDGTFDNALTFKINRRSDGKWQVSGGTINLKPQYQKKGVGAAIHRAVIETVNRLTNLKELDVNAIKVGRYTWSRVPGAKFVDPKDIHVRYLRWVKSREDKAEAIIGKPATYPKRFYLSRFSPHTIGYVVPIPNR